MTDKAREAFKEWVRTAWAVEGGYIRSHSDRQMTDAEEAFAAGWNTSQNGAREALKHLFTVTLEELDLNAHAIVTHGHADVGNWYDPEDADAPFFTEACLYNLLGKGDARTVLALVRNVGRALGIDERDLP